MNDHKKNRSKFPEKFPASNSSGEGYILHPTFHSPFLLLIIIAFSVFICEAFIMALLSILPPFPTWFEALFDSFFLIVLLSPLFYFFLFRPMVNHISERKRAEERIAHLNAVLRAIRNVNQLITREKDRDRLLQAICESLIGTRGYYNAWIALLDESCKLVATAEAGLGEDFLPMLEQLNRGELTKCGGSALEQSQVVVIEDPSSDCSDCPLVDKYGGRGGMSVRLKNGGKIYGFLTVSTPKDHVAEEEEQTLLKEVASDIALALHSIKMEDERNRAQGAMRESEQKFTTIAASAQDAVIMMDSEGNISYWNAAAQKIFGYSDREALGKELHILLAPQRYHEAYRKGFSHFKKTGQGPMIGKTIELIALRKDGSEFSIELSLSSVKQNHEWYAIGIIRDISERKSAEEALIRLKTAVEHASECIVITDKDGAIQYANPAFERITGHTRQEAVGQNPRILKSGEQDEAFYRVLWDTITTGEVWTGHLINRKKDGTLYEEDASISPVIDNSGAVTNYVAVKRDVTREVRMETQLRQAQKMEAIGTLAGGIAHDFNNVLYPIVGYTEMSIDDVTQGSIVQRNLKEVLKAATRAQDLVRQILTFSRQSEQVRKPLKLQPIIKDALKLLRASLPSTIKIIQNIDTECGAVEADHVQIHQVLMNLCTNAFHAMREKGGELEVTLTEADIDSGDLASDLGLKPGPYLKLTVSDTGHGMDRDVAARIFDPYFTTKAPGAGTGMGLSVVHGIVKSHGGDIKVYSVEGEGSAFHVYLPEIESTPLAPEPIVTEPVQGGNEHILLVDDEEQIVGMVKQMLERLGYQVTARTSSLEALEAFRAKPPKYDLVITDQTMPNMTGAELAPKLLVIRPDIPIIICTGFSELITEDKAKALGIRAYVMKPVVMNEIAKTIRNVLDAEE